MMNNKLLFEACISGDKDVVRFLLKNKAIRQIEINTAIAVAFRHDNIEIATLLIDEEQNTVPECVPGFMLGYNPNSQMPGLGMGYPQQTPPWQQQSPWQQSPFGQNKPSENYYNQNKKPSEEMTPIDYTMMIKRIDEEIGNIKGSDIEIDQDMKDINTKRLEQLEIAKTVIRSLNTKVKFKL